MPRRSFSFEVIEAALDDYKRDLESFDARIQMRVSFPMQVQSLRSGLSGWQYYDIALELVERAGVRKKIVHLDYVYSRPAPARWSFRNMRGATRGQLATPHSQRSVARHLGRGDGRRCLWFEDLIELARTAVPTETQVMVKREDEQAFAELNAANPIFVEDAARSFCEALQARPADRRLPGGRQPSGTPAQPRRGQPADAKARPSRPKASTRACSIADPRGLTARFAWSPQGAP